MNSKVSIKLGFVTVLALLLFVTLFNPITVGYNTNIKTTRVNEKQNMYNNSYDRYALLDPNSPEINIPEKNKTETLSDNTKTSGSPQFEKQKEEPIITAESFNNPLDSQWPMYCHDVRHTGRSPYSTTDNPGIEQWRFDVIETCWGSPVIDNEGIIYIGAFDLFAVYPNGTEKWRFDADSGIFRSAPAIDENGILYVGSIWGHPNYLYAIYKSNGTLKWKYPAGDHIEASPVIGEDGTIYFCDCGNWQIKALYPNGTLKWSYKTNYVVYSSPSIGLDGTIYCGSHDKHLYALYPNNGTLKWKYKTGDWVGRGPCIADDGTIYFGSWDGNLYACHPNGTLKWKTGTSFATTPVIGHDGTIYGGCYYLFAVNPGDGSVKWSFDPGEYRTIRGGNPCISSEGIIYFGTHIRESDGGELIAVNPDGTERWRIMLASDWIWSAPAIDEDGTVYAGSSNNKYQSGSWGYLHAVGPFDPDAPNAPMITGQTNGTIEKEYEYNFKSTSPLSRDIYYYIEWGDGSTKDLFGPYNSGEKVAVSHVYSIKGTYTIRAYARDIENLRGPWGELKVTIPRNKATSNLFLAQFLERFPLLTRLLPLLK